MRTLLLVGRSSNGKSSIGNSILGGQVFSLRSPSEGVRLGNERRSNNDYIVVDCSGIGDTVGEINRDVKCVIQSALDGLMLCDSEKEMTLNGKHHNSSGGPTLCNDNYKNQGTSDQNLKMDETVDELKCGFDALIFVLKYGVRFTKQEKDAVQMVKSIFGENVFRDWGILVFSYGDNFYLDTEDDGMTFEDWCQEQTGDIKTLFEEVGYRCVLFDNKSRDEKKQNLQREILTTYITKIMNSQKGKYTHAEFVSADAGKVKLLLQSQFKGIESDVQRLIQESDEGARKMEEIHPEWMSQLETLKQVHRQLLSEKEKLETKDQGTELLRDLVTQVRCQILKIKSALEKVSVSPGRHISNSEISNVNPGGHSANPEISAVSPGGSGGVIGETAVPSRARNLGDVESKRNADSESAISGSREWCIIRKYCCCFSQDRYNVLDETNPSIQKNESINSNGLNFLHR
ncbi:unnamed protein product [Lymnaea stagnalis]|uniref:AIG1-type G domain-containing protein n=1 Tax=Lymnaea stagnalis TaxID=6523 RepID=A0AAV2IJ74_LYMST